MNLFTSELFNGTMLEQIQPRPRRHYNQPAFGRRYGRHAMATPPESTPALLLECGAIARVGDTCVLLDYDAAA